MTSDPELLRREIELTQRGLSADVNALTEKVTPSRIVQRRVGRARRALTTMTDTIMGTASDTTDRMGSTASSVAGNVSSTASTVAGNPLAAGLIAFGFGWLTASLLPPSKREQDIADQAKDLAYEHVQPVVGEMAEQLKDNLREPAEHAVESVTSTAKDAGSTVADETRSAAEDVERQAREATGKVREQVNPARSS
jgi:ElaB/YqjD/DUF883 family membrane-anchored ribosome-binding protein